ncbi:GlxA family transcriptional regulator [Flexivirga meconopsidis]|uniref:GlxA family transcriptional regulator n=1 Tax=Flexivirga meconopsidis TaxID=2977121 RepID=UPI0022408E38
MKPNRAERVTFVVFDGVQSLDLTGPLEVLEAANDVLRSAGRAPAYELRVVAARSAVRSSSGLRLSADPLPDLVQGTLVIPGGYGTREPQPELLAWLRECRPHRLMTVCTGAFLAGDAGLLDGAAVTTHWAYADELACRLPNTRVMTDPIYHRDGHIWSSGGVTAGIDLGLAVIEDDCGSEVAQTVSRHMVMSLRRDGNQSQFAGPVRRRRAHDDRISAVQRSIDADPQHDHRVEVLARAAQLSPRQFQRRFAAEVGVSVGEYVTSARIDIAKTLLTTTDSTVASVARDCGFASAESLRRGFQMRCGTSPSAYRRRFTTGSST